MVSRRQSPFVFALALGALAAGALVPRNAAAQAPGPSAEPPAQAGSAGSQPSSGSTGASGENLIPQESTTGSTGAQPGSTPAVDPASDQAKLLKQGTERPTNDGTVGARPSEVYSEDWWAHTRPIVELHGYFRTRGELYHNFSLGRPGDVGTNPQFLWPQPIDNSYINAQGNPRQVLACGSNGVSECKDKTQATANLRIRLNPEIHISDNLRVMSQIDLLDNLVLGSTPDAYAIKPQVYNPKSTTGGNGSGYASAGYNGYAPLGAFSTTQGQPTAGVNGYRNSIDVQRAWAEYLTPLGQVRFGRMPSHGDLFDARPCRGLIV